MYKNPSDRGLFILLLAAVASFIPCLWLPITGEEGVYATGAYELLQHHHWLKPTILGQTDWRPPLYQWFNVGTFYLLGQGSMLLAMRIVTVFATLASTLALMSLSFTLIKDRHLALFTGLCYLSGDVLLRRGWIAYSDPTFSAFVFIAIATLWISVQTQRRSLMPLACLALSLGFLSKVITAYIFYGVFFVCLGFFHENRKQLIAPISIISHLAAVGIYIFWSLCVLPMHGSGLIIDITRQLQLVHWGSYAGKIAIFPVHLLWQLFPASILAVWAWYQSSQRTLRTHEKIAFWTVIFNILPYWFSPHVGATRYVLPMVPLMILLLSHLIWRADKRILHMTLSAIIVFIIIKVMYVTVFLPNYHQKQRGDFPMIAQDILKHVQNHPLYVTDTSYIGFDIATTLDQALYPHRVITELKPVTTPAFILETETTAQSGILIADYRLGDHHLYLRRLG